VIAAARERLDRIELVPFARGISAGAACVLTAHVALPEVEPAGAILPASLSPTVVQGLLRGGLGFDGVAITDCLEMDAVAAGVGMARGAVQAIRAGNDIALVSHRADRQGAALDAILAAVAQREITSERLGEAVDRVLRLKRRHLWWDRLPAPGGLGVVGGPTHRALAARAYAASTTIIRDDHAQIPLRLAPGERLLVVVVPPRAVTAASDSVLDEDGLLAGVGRLHPDSTLTRAAPGDGDGGGLADMAASADLVVLITINCHADERHRATAARIAAAARRVVGLAAGDPYDAGVLPSIGTFLASYDYATPALVAAFDVIFGRRVATGRLPVTI
jgi:beta-N-acetylhexosaminidase